MVAPVIGEGVCPGCGGTTRLRKGLVVKYCREACGKKHRARVNHYGTKRWEREKRARVRHIVMGAIRTDPELARDVLLALERVDAADGSR
jgi:hypothetical protein